MATPAQVSKKVQAWGKDYRRMKEGKPVGNPASKRTINKEAYEKARAVARPTSTKAERLTMNQMRLRQATAMQRSRGTYDSYDPLKSTAQNLSVRQKSSKPKSKGKSKR